MVLANHSSVGKRIKVILQNLTFIFFVGNNEEMFNKFLGQLLRDVFEHFQGKIILLSITELNALNLGSFDGWKPELFWISGRIQKYADIINHLVYDMVSFMIVADSFLNPDLQESKFKVNVVDVWGYWDLLDNVCFLFDGE